MNSFPQILEKHAIPPRYLFRSARYENLYKKTARDILLFFLLRSSSLRFIFSPCFYRRRRHRSAAFLYISSASERYGHGTDGDIVASAALEQ